MTGIGLKRVGFESFGTSFRTWGGRMREIPADRRDYWGERETVGERREKGFPKMETLNLKNRPKIETFKNSVRLSLTITFPYKLRFMCISCLRTQFNETYNSREENLSKF
jgi:hypothetical protein